MDSEKSGAQSITTTRSVALSITDPAMPGFLLIVKRPPDDPDLPDVWGLPAASRRPGESWLDAANRAARDKLGVDITITKEIGRGKRTRETGILELRLFAAKVRQGRPRVPQAVPSVTQYVALKWALTDALEAGARAGSLCCRLQLGWPSEDQPLAGLPAPDTATAAMDITRGR